ncbi:hypothetical protein MVEG_11555 [Podila verticillata NRRL 6337]|uniref:Uncharacterized protein n=1 Tax=Podila verticillata NRRL 6337 TaxID=1069443 RepID=A0A086TK68_9FUNG|nr:hypothetical protein MVEG_11555 [Podila verticillata NRRL 6337]
MKSYSNNRPQGRGGSSQGSMRGKSISTRLSAPAPVNLPSRRQELAGSDAHVSQASSWGSPSAAATAVLGAPSASSTPGDSPIVPATGTMTTTQTGTTTLANGVAGGDSPHLDASPIGSPYHRPITRAWGAVTQPTDQRLEEYPTAAEAAKKVHHDHHESPLTSGGHGVTNGKKASVDDEGVDFLNAGEIQFADGSVVVTATVASSDAQDPGKDTASAKAPVKAPERREERVVDRGEVDFNRAWPNRNSSTSGPSSSFHHYQPTEHQLRYPPHDKAHPQLWQGGAPSSHRENDRRPSADRGHIPTNQRRDSAGHAGPNRRDSYGSKEPFSGPRRDSAGQHSNYYDRRDSFEQQHRQRDRDRDRSFPKENYGRDRDNREGDFNPDRRPSYDRPLFDRMPERHQRDFHVLARPKDHLSDRHGPHDQPSHPDPSGHPLGHPFAHPAGHGSNEPQPPSATNTHDTLQRDPEHVPNSLSSATLDHDHQSTTGDQKEAMRHAAEEARKRRENEEREFAESQARARAKADALAKQAEEIKLAKAKEKEEEEAKAKLKEDQLLFKTSLSKSEVEEAMASWVALPKKLVKESQEKDARNREEWRRREEESKKTAISSSTHLPTASPAPVPTIVGAWKRSGNVVTGKGTLTSEKSSVAKEEKSPVGAGITSNGLSSGAHEIRVDQVDMIMHRIEDSLQARGTSVQEVGASMKRPSETHRPIASGTPPDPTNSVETSTHQEPAEENTLVKDKPRNAKVARGKPSVDSPASAASWRKEDPTSNALLNSTSTQEEGLKASEKVVTSATNSNPVMESNKVTVKIESRTTPHDIPTINGHTKSGHVLTTTKINKEFSKPVATPILSSDSYPAKMTGLNGVTLKISDISRIHARLAHQAAGDVYANQEIGEIGHKARPANKHPSKRNSLSNSTVATIFPSNVEQAALKRGSMSFMVDSEIDMPLNKDDSAPETVLSMQTSQWGDSKTALPHLAASLSKIELPANDNAKKAWDSTLIAEANDVSATIFTPGTLDIAGNVARFPQGSTAPQAVPMGMGPNMYLVNAQAGIVNPMAQPMWTQPVESSQGSMAPSIVVPSAGGPPFPMVLPYYHPRGFPVNGVPPGYMVMYHQGMPPPPMAQFASIPPSRLSVDGSVSPMGPLRSLTGSPDIHSDSMNDSSENCFIPQQAASAADDSGAVVEPMRWLPRFSVAGDAPQPQAPFILPHSQASIMAAANINRIPQSRPYGMTHHLHQPPQHLSRNHGSPIEGVPGSSMPNSGFHDSPSSPSMDGWTSPSSRHQAPLVANNDSVALPSQSTSQPQTPQAPSKNSQASSWVPSGRPNVNGSFGYQGAQPLPFHQQPHHPGNQGSHRGRGGFSNNANFHHYRDFRPNGRGGFGHHPPQHHHYHSNPQHYPNGPSSSSGAGSHGPERHGRTANNDSPSGFNGFPHHRMSQTPSTGVASPPVSSAPSTF